MIDHSSLRIQVDRERCIGSALCVATAGKYFELDEEHFSRPKAATADDSDALQAAVELCPVAAISASADRTG